MRLWAARIRFYPVTHAFHKDSHGFPDANPEFIVIGSPLDGTNNPSACTGQTFEDITGVIQYQLRSILEMMQCGFLLTAFVYLLSWLL